MGKTTNFALAGPQAPPPPPASRRAEARPTTGNVGRMSSEPPRPMVTRNATGVVSKGTRHWNVKPTTGLIADGHDGVPTLAATRVAGKEAADRTAATTAFGSNGTAGRDVVVVAAEAERGVSSASNATVAGSGHDR